MRWGESGMAASCPRLTSFHHAASSFAPSNPPPQVPRERHPRRSANSRVEAKITPHRKDCGSNPSTGNTRVCEGGGQSPQCPCPDLKMTNGSLQLGGGHKCGSTHAGGNSTNVREVAGGLGAPEGNDQEGAARFRLRTGEGERYDEGTAGGPDG